MNYEINEEIGFINELNYLVRGVIKKITASIAPIETTFYHLEIEGIDELILINESDVVSSGIGIGVPLFDIGQTVGVENYKTREIDKGVVLSINIDIDKDYDLQTWYDLSNGTIVCEEEIIYVEPLVKEISA